MVAAVVRPKPGSSRTLHPRDILDQLLDVAKYKRSQPVASAEMLDRACRPTLRPVGGIMLITAEPQSDQVKVLIVDDNPILIEGWKGILSWRATRSFLPPTAWRRSPRSCPRARTWCCWTCMVARRLRGLPTHQGQRRHLFLPVIMVTGLSDVEYR